MNDPAGAATSERSCSHYIRWQNRPVTLDGLIIVGSEDELREHGPLMRGATIEPYDGERTGTRHVLDWLEQDQ